MEYDRVNTSEILQQIQQDVDTAVSLEEVLDRILRRAVELVSARDGSLMLLDEKGELSFRARVGGPVPRDKEGRSFKLGEGIAGSVAQSHKYYICADTQADPAFTRIISGEPIRSLVSVPIVSHGAVLGVLNVDSSQPRRFSPADAELLMALASQTAVAIERAELFEALREISSTVSSTLDLKEVAGKILDEMGKVVKYRSASLQLIQGDVRTQIAGRGFKKKAVPKWALRPISQDRLVKGIVDSKKPLILTNLSDLSKVPEWTFHKETADVKSWVGLPLVYGEEVIGLLTFDHDQPGFYTPATEDLLITLANQAAIAVKNKRLLEDTQRRIRDLEIVSEVTQVVNTKLSPQEVFKTIVSQIQKQLNCTHCTIFLPEEENGERVLKPQATSGGREQVMERRFKLGEGLAGWVFQNGESVVLDNVMENAHFAPARERRGEPRSMLVAPVKVGDQTIGVISADQDKYGWFSDNDRLLLDALAQQAGIAIQRSVGLGLLQDIGNRIIGAHEECEILEGIVSGAIKLTNTTSGVIYLIGEDGQSVTEDYHYPQHFQPPPLRLKQKEGLTYQIIADRKPIAIPDIKQDKRANRDLLELGVRSIIGIPLSLTERVIGVLYLNDNERHNFTETEISLLSTLADQAAIAIEKVQLYETMVGLNAQLESLHRVAQRHDLGEVLDQTVKGIGDLLGEGTSPTINLYDKETDSFGECHAYGPLQEDLMTPPRSSGGTGKYVLATGQPLYLEDVHNPPPGRPTVRAESIALGIQSFAAIPLKGQDRMVGVLFVNLQKPFSFSEEIKRVLELFASQAAIAIENARLYSHISQNLERRIRELEILAEIGRTVSAMGVDEILEQIHTQVDKLMDARNLYIAFYDADTDTVSFPLAYGDGKKIETGVGAWAPRGRAKPLEEGEERKPGESRYGLTEYVIDRGEPEISKGDMWGNWSKKRKIELSPSIPTKSWIGVPLKVGGKIIGVISTQSHERIDAYDENDLRVLETIANQAAVAAVAIENARLYAEMEKRVEERTQEWRQAQQKAAAAEKQAAINSVAGELVHKMNNLAGTIPGRVKLAKERLDPDDPRDKRIINIVDSIQNDALNLLEAAKHIRESTAAETMVLLDANEMLRTAVNIVHNALPIEFERIVLTEEYADGPFYIVAPRNSFLRGIEHLLRNAVEAMPDGGKLSVVCREITLQNQRYVEMTISDSGVGIKLAEISKIFDLFYTTKPLGMGFGLWDVKNIVKSIEGEIEVESLMPGAKFTIRIPEAASTENDIRPEVQAIPHK